MQQTLCDRCGAVIAPPARPSYFAVGPVGIAQAMYFAAYGATTQQDGGVAGATKESVTWQSLGEVCQCCADAIRGFISPPKAG